MHPPFQKITDVQAQAETLRQRAYGIIEMGNDKLVAVHLRPWPKFGSILESWWDDRWRRNWRTGNRCWLYYNQPLFHRNFMSLMYIASTKKTTLATIHGALVVLDEIARIKQTDALMCNVTNPRISDRMLQREGWERHCLDSPGRNFIKRFYGVYPPSPTSPCFPRSNSR